MVRLGFIVEGDTEKILLESDSFRSFLNSLGIEFIPDIINVAGNNNLLPHKRKEFTDILKSKGADVIIILTDQDADKCVTETKKRISPQEGQICVVAKKTIESWFLADSQTLRDFIEDNISVFENPEDEPNPFDRIRQIRIEKKRRGFLNNKRYLANSMLLKGFSFERAAEHPNCSSAKYFIDKLKQLAKN